MGRSMNQKVTSPLGLIVLKYNDMEESSCSKHLDVQWRNEMASSNPNMREAVKANNGIFSSLALLYNLCASA
jgi:hypothetical protein